MWSSGKSSTGLHVQCHCAIIYCTIESWQVQNKVTWKAIVRRICGVSLFRKANILWIGSHIIILTAHDCSAQQSNEIPISVRDSQMFQAASLLLWRDISKIAVYGLPWSVSTSLWPVGKVQENCLPLPLQTFIAKVDYKLPFYNDWAKAQSSVVSSLFHIATLTVQEDMSCLLLRYCYLHAIPPIQFSLFARYTTKLTAGDASISRTRAISTAAFILQDKITQFPCIYIIVSFAVSRKLILDIPVSSRSLIWCVRDAVRQSECY